ncbi:hypothetical protein BCR41DRAFT_373532 [Lobosporangium transversale]|uniref:Uncharacterized protein n=1 Tax=Lobosporangium transversale TaxID=64571 RepID=A0A1Y2GDH6_9FUNG|nr:hypothetical protein BCR41DRAFT_373532 [Lobosporangium transversale]ORZ07778.1 hypothetical protein BCR41DRAFT_373532 [Lobosporangium transversale]|eukprot:XP_021878144.1 hypothetical protein BCR41DRAFT_373532 [Lobosporangium transversale]
MATTNRMSHFFVTKEGNLALLTVVTSMASRQSMFAEVGLLLNPLCHHQQFYTEISRQQQSTDLSPTSSLSPESTSGARQMKPQQESVVGVTLKHSEHPCI